MNTSFCRELSQILDLELSESEMAIALEGAARAMLQKAATGTPVIDPFTYRELGIVTAALHWHANPLMKAAVKVKNNAHG